MLEPCNSRHIDYVCQLFDFLDCFEFFVAHVASFSFHSSIIFDSASSSRRKRFGKFRLLFDSANRITHGDASTNPAVRPLFFPPSCLQRLAPCKRQQGLTSKRLPSNSLFTPPCLLSAHMPPPAPLSTGAHTRRTPMQTCRFRQQILAHRS